MAILRKDQFERMIQSGNKHIVDVTEIQDTNRLQIGYIKRRKYANFDNKK